MIVLLFAVDPQPLVTRTQKVVVTRRESVLSVAESVPTGFDVSPVEPWNQA